MEGLTVRERFRRAMRFEPVDRLPVMEWAPWWRDKTIARWKTEGLPADLTTNWDIGAYFGLDDHRQCWVRAIATDAEVDGRIPDAAAYDRALPLLYPPSPFDAAQIREWAMLQAKGDTVVWLTLEGAFWFPRRLLGIERHLFAFYDQPELMKRIIADLVAHNLRVLDEFCSICVPDFVSFAEDMSYNHGPMISEGLFEEFIAPFYRSIAPAIEERGSFIIVDSDGDVTRLMPWFAAVGVDGFLPLERRAGVDLTVLRRDWPRSRFIGHFDKTVMSSGEEAVRREFERLLPTMKQGGFIPSVDHQTPPDVSIDDYRVYVRLLKEYCARAGNSS